MLSGTELLPLRIFMRGVKSKYTYNSRKPEIVLIASSLFVARSKSGFFLDELKKTQGEKTSKLKEKTQAQT